MLEEKDLKKIRSVVREEVNTAIDTKVGDLIEKRLKPIKEDVAEIRKEIKTVVDFFDNEYLDLRSRVDRIEEVLNLKPAERSSR